MARTDLGSAQRIARATILHADRLDALVARAQAGERNAFARLVRDTLDEVRAACAVRVPAGEAIADAVRETYLLVHRRLGAYRLGTGFLGWLSGAAREAAGRVARARAAAGPVDAIDEAIADRRLAQAVSGPDGDDAAAERSGDLRPCLDRLSPAAQALLARRYLDRVPLDELAREAGRAPSWAAGTLLRVRTTLRECILGGHRWGRGVDARYAELLERWLEGGLHEPARPVLADLLRDGERREELVAQATMHQLLLVRLPVVAPGWLADEERRQATVSAAAAAREEAAAQVMAAVPDGPPGCEEPPEPAPVRPPRRSVAIESPLPQPAPHPARRWTVGVAVSGAVLVALAILLPGASPPPAATLVDGAARVAGRDLAPGAAIPAGVHVQIAGGARLRPHTGATVELTGSGRIALDGAGGWRLLAGGLRIGSPEPLRVETPYATVALDGGLAELVLQDALLEAAPRVGALRLHAGVGDRSVAPGARALAGPRGWFVVLVHAQRPDATLAARLDAAGWVPVAVPAAAVAGWQDRHFARCAALVLLPGVDPVPLASRLRALACGVVISEPRQMPALGLGDGVGSATVDRILLPGAGEVRLPRATAAWTTLPWARPLATLDDGERCIAFVADRDAAAPGGALAGRRAGVLVRAGRPVPAIDDLWMRAVRFAAAGE